MFANEANQERKILLFINDHNQVCLWGRKKIEFSNAVGSLTSNMSKKCAKNHAKNLE